MPPPKLAAMPKKKIAREKHHSVIDLLNPV